MKNWAFFSLTQAPKPSIGTYYRYVSVSPDLAKTVKVRSDQWKIWDHSKKPDRTFWRAIVVLRIVILLRNPELFLEYCLKLIYFDLIFVDEKDESRIFLIPLQTSDFTED